MILQVQRHHSELQLSLQLNKPSVVDSSRDERRIRYIHALNLSKELISNIVDRGIKIWVIEQIEELKTNSKRSILPSVYFSVLHDREIGIEISWTAKTVLGLGEGDS